MKFTKMHGAGNDYIYINCLDGKLLSNINELAIRLSDRHFGVGADGVVLILPSENATAKMRMFNADGSEGKMCGNAIRCVGKYLYDRQLICSENITIDTLSGIKHLSLKVKNNKVDSVEVDMGFATTDPQRIPLVADEEMLDVSFSVGQHSLRGTAISMGNPHLVLKVDDVDAYNLLFYGPQWETHPLFPDKVNTEIVQVVDRTHIKMRVWERGSGETLACGTGACAAVAALALLNEVDYYMQINVALKGGDLSIKVGQDLHVFMTGPAQEVFEGEII